MQLKPRLIGWSRSGVIAATRPSSTVASKPQNAVQIEQKVLWVVPVWVMGSSACRLERVGTRG